MQPLDLNTWADLLADRPIAVVDLETTDADAAACGVVEVAVAAYGIEQVRTAGEQLAERVAAGERLSTLIYPEPAWSHCARVNPGMPIPPGATDIHGIRDEDVAGLAGFESIGPILANVAATHTIVTFNGRKFDLPIIARLQPDFAPVQSIDLMGLWHGALRTAVPAWFGEGEPCGQTGRPTPRLVGDQLYRAGGVGSASTGAVKVYKDSLEGCHYGLLGYPLTGAHGALADVLGTGRALFALLALWGAALPTGADGLAAFAEANLAAVWPVNGVQTLLVGNKHKGRTIAEIYQIDPSYLGWFLCDTFDDADKARVVEVIGQANAETLVMQQQRKTGKAPGGRRRKPDAAA